MTKTLTREDLRQFSGSETWYRHAFVRSVLYTDGVKHVAEAGGAYWLIDEIAFGQHEKKIAAEPFQVWKLLVTGNTATQALENDAFLLDPVTRQPVAPQTLTLTVDALAQQVHNALQSTSNSPAETGTRVSP